MALSTIGRNQLNTGIADNSDATAITIDSSERIGIGVTPERQLHVEGSGAEISLVDTQRTSNSRTANMFIDSSNRANLRMMNDAMDSAAVGVQFDSSGRVTMPNQPSFQAKSNLTNLTLSNYAGATYHLNIFNNEFFDIGNNFNTTNSTFTAPVAGRYYVYTQLQLSSSPTTTDHSWGVNLHFQVNGSGNHANGYVSLSTGQGGGSTTLFGSYGLLVKENILNLSVNDTVRVALTGNANINAGGIETNTNDG